MMACLSVNLFSQIDCIPSVNRRHQPTSENERRRNEVNLVSRYIFGKKNELHLLSFCIE